jgi:uncharacterized protein
LLIGILLSLRLPTTPPRGRRRPSVAKVVAAGVGGGIALAAGVAVLEALAATLGQPIVEQPWVENIARSQNAAPLAVLVLVAVFVAPAGEELFYRGWAFRYLAPAGAPVAYGASALLFALVHLHPPAFPAYLLLGLGLAALYRWSGSLWVATLAHATNNLIAIGMLLAAR